MARTSMYRLVDRAFDGRLADELRRMRDEKYTYDQMTRAFATRGIELSRETLRRWTLALEDPEKVA